MDIDEVGEILEHAGFSDDEIDDYFEHHGVKGQKWGVRRAEKRAARSRNRELNKASRANDTQAYRNSIDKARAKFDSGQAQREYKKANAQYKIDKMNLGSREARKIRNAKRAKLDEQWQTAMQVRDGKELATSMILGGLGAVAIAALQTR